MCNSSGWRNPSRDRFRPLRVLSPGEFESFSKETSPNVREADGFTDAPFSLLYSLSGKRKLTILSELFRYAPRTSYNPIPPQPLAKCPPTLSSSAYPVLPSPPPTPFPVSQCSVASGCKASPVARSQVADSCEDSLTVQRVAQRAVQSVSALCSRRTSRKG